MRESASSNRLAGKGGSFQPSEGCLLIGGAAGSVTPTPPEHCAATASTQAFPYDGKAL